MEYLKEDTCLNSLAVRVAHAVVGGPPVVDGVIGAERGALPVISRREAVQPAH